MSPSVSGGIATSCSGVHRCGDARTHKPSPGDGHGDDDNDWQRVVGDRHLARAERSTDLVFGIGELGAMKGRPSPSGRSFAAVTMPSATGRHTLLPTSCISHSDLRSAQTNSAMISASSRFVPASLWTRSVRSRVSKRDTIFPGNRAMLGSDVDLTTGAGVHPAGATGGASSGRGCSRSSATGCLASTAKLRPAVALDRRIPVAARPA